MGMGGDIRTEGAPVLEDELVSMGPGSWVADAMLVVVAEGSFDVVFFFNKFKSNAGASLNWRAQQFDLKTVFLGIRFIYIFKFCQIVELIVLSIGQTSLEIHLLRNYLVLFFQI